MSLIYKNIKIGVEENGEVKYLTDVQLSKDHEEKRISYQLSADGQVFSNEGGTEVLKYLHQNEPNKSFIVIDAGVDAEE